MGTVVNCQLHDDYIVDRIGVLLCMQSQNTACVNKSASLKEHFFLRKLYVIFVKVYNNMIGNIINFYRIFVLCNLDLWFRNYSKSCKVPPNLWFDSLLPYSPLVA